MPFTVVGKYICGILAVAGLPFVVDPVMFLLSLLLLLNDFLDDAIAPSAAVISDFNRISAFAGIHTVLAVLLSLSFLRLLAFLLL